MAIPPTQSEVAAFLSHLAGTPALETHISAVFRGPDTVWKLKKAVRLGFLDFVAVADRKRFLDRELALNAPHVPGLYRDVAPIARNGTSLAIGTGGPAVDWVLRMARVPESDFLDQVARDGGLTPDLLHAIADVVAGMHARQAQTGADDPVGRMHAVAAGNATAARAAGLDEDGVAEWQAGMRAALDRAAPSLQARAPLIRRAHGDLHLGNMLLWHGRPAPFDALEFDEDLATIDPAYDLAFLLMDLEQKASRAAANRVLSRYVARTGDAGLVAGLVPFLSMRAMIRAHVAAARGQRDPALESAALAYLCPARPILVAIGGLMGTGKSTLARALAPALGPAPGALVLSSDGIRKRLHGLAPEQPLPASAYTPASHEATMRVVLDGVKAAIAGRHAVIVDATFLDPAVRGAVEAQARAAGVAFQGIWLDVPLPELERRVAARRGDESDADLEVLRAAARAPIPPPHWFRVDATAADHALHQVQTRLEML